MFAIAPVTIYIGQYRGSAGDKRLLLALSGRAHTVCVRTIVRTQKGTTAGRNIMDGVYDDDKMVEYLTEEWMSHFQQGANVYKPNCKSRKG